MSEEYEMLELNFGNKRKVKYTIQDDSGIQYYYEDGPLIQPSCPMCGCQVVTGSTYACGYSAIGTQVITPCNAIVAENQADIADVINAEFDVAA